VRRRWSAALAALVALTGAIALLVRRGLRVLHSVPVHAAYWKQRAEDDGDLLYVALGDSTAQGVGAHRPDDGYVGALARDLEESTGRSVRVVNLSVSGARVAALVAEQLPVLEKLVADGSAPALVTVTIGANDTGRTPVEDFTRDMGTVIDALPAGSLVAEVPFFNGRRGADAARFSAIIRDLVERRGDLVAVGLFDATRRLRPREYAHDFFHPSARGYERYHRAFRQAQGRESHPS
jgi:lysophospholipase L1-like esterase